MFIPRAWLAWQADPAERPDFVIHSYTKDLSGTGSVIAGVVIGRNEDMFIPKGESAGGDRRSAADPDLP